MAVHVQVLDRVGVVVIDRPEKRNAVDLATLSSLVEAQSRTAAAGCRVLVVRGAPPAFCSGADLDGVELGEFTDLLTRALHGFVDWPGTTVAFVDGPALGAGLQIAAACDLRIATRTSVFGIPAAKLGLAVDAWTVERMAREIGWSQARAMLLTGDSTTGADLESRFVTRLTVAPSGADALEEALAIVTEWSTRAPLTVHAHKIALDRAAGAAISEADVEIARLAAWTSHDAVEGRTAFRERRPPDFRGQ